MSPLLSRLFATSVRLAVLISLSPFFSSNAAPLETDRKDPAIAYETKKMAEEYWAQFKQDSNQTWKTTRAAFRDGWVEGKLETALSINRHLTPFHIGITVDDSKAVLLGEVSSEIERELAENITLGIEGIDSVDNRIRVNRNLAPNREKEEDDDAGRERNFSQYMSDVSTTATVKTKLLNSPNISAMAIDVTTYNDRVTLNGTVKTRQERELAEAIAHKQAGVKKVINNLEVAS